MKSHFYRDQEDGKWKSTTDNNASFVDLQLFYLNRLDPVFKLAKEKCEFEFILSLLRFTGMRDAGWDSFENLIEIHRIFYKIQSLKLREAEKAHNTLFTYGLIIEASVPYELLANLINVIKGDRYILANFPDHIDPNTGKNRSQTVISKIDQLKSKAKSIGIDLGFFDDFVDNKLRNGIFHSDYAVYWPEVRITHPEKKYTHDEWTLLVDKSLAYIASLINLYNSYIGSYELPEIIEPHPEFNTNGGKITTIVRKGYGVIGFKDTWTDDEIARGAIPHRLGRFLPYEVALIEKGQLLLPYNKIEKFNSRIKYLPSYLKRYLVKKFRKNFGF